MTPTGANVAKDISDRTGAEISAAQETLKDKSAKVTDTVHDFVARGAKKASELGDSARDHLSSAADRVSENASDTLDAGKHAYRASRAAVGQRVAKQPLEALMLAAAIGYLVGWATNRS